MYVPPGDGTSIAAAGGESRVPEVCGSDARIETRGDGVDTEGSAVGTRGKVTGETTGTGLLLEVGVGNEEVDFEGDAVGEGSDALDDEEHPASRMP